MSYLITGSVVVAIMILMLFKTFRILITASRNFNKEDIAIKRYHHIDHIGSVLVIMIGGLFATIFKFVTLFHMFKQIGIDADVLLPYLNTAYIVMYVGIIMLLCHIHKEERKDHPFSNFKE